MGLVSLAILVSLTISIRVVAENDNGHGVVRHELSEQLDQARPITIPDQEMTSHTFKPQTHIEDIQEHNTDNNRAESSNSIDTECMICLDYIVASSIDSKSTTLQTCPHEFHKHCLDQWVAIHNSCPICRAIIHLVSKPSPPPLRMVHAVGHFVGNCFLSLALSGTFIVSVVVGGPRFATDLANNLTTTIEWY